MAKAQNIAERVTDLALNLEKNFSCEIVDVEWQREGGVWTLRIFIDREDKPVDHDLCADFSHAISEILDKEDFIADNYMLEISSPGLERPLKKEKDFIRFAGETVEVKLFAPLDGVKKAQGELLGMEEGNVKLQTSDKLLLIPFDKIAKAHIVFQF